MKTNYLRAIVLLLLPFLIGCSARMGDLTTISTRNVDKSVTYKELSRYVEGKDKVVSSILFIPIYKKPNFEAATDNAVKKIPNGEYLKNATIISKWRWYLLWTTEEITITGDVWGESKDDKLKVGSEVSFKLKKQLQKGKITRLDGSKAIIKYKVNGKTKLKAIELTELSN